MCLPYGANNTLWQIKAMPGTSLKKKKIEACRKCVNRIESFSRRDKYNIPIAIKTVSITFRVAVCIDAL